MHDDELLTKYAKRVRLGDRRAANSASVIALAQHQTGEPLASANASTKPPGVGASAGCRIEKNHGWLTLPNDSLSDAHRKAKPLNRWRSRRSEEQLG